MVKARIHRGPAPWTWCRARWDTERPPRPVNGTPFPRFPARWWKSYPNLKNGAVVAAGETLLAIDPTDYQLAAAQIEPILQSVSPNWRN